MVRPWRLAPRSPRLSLLDHLLRGAAALLGLAPARLIQTLIGESPRNQRGESLDDHLHLLLKMERMVAGPALPTLTQRRQKMRKGIALIDGSPTPIGGLVETVLGGNLPARVYRPSDCSSRPWMLYLHGGGWATGDLDSHDRICRRICAESDLLVIALDYRLSPETPFPGAIHDVRRAWIDAADLAARLGAERAWACVGGDSAGGNLAAVLCHQHRDLALEEPKPVLQLLVYPAMDFNCADASHREFAEGYLLTKDSIDTYKAMYAPPDDTDPDASPVLHPNLRNLPHTIVITAGFDPLRDEGERYARLAAAAGTSVVHLAEPGLVHGFLQMDAVLPAADAAVQRMLGALRQGLNAHRP